jgi:serine/threonine protein kinase
MRTGHGLSVDWWSLGALIYEMTVGRPPFVSRDRGNLFEKILHDDLEFPKSVSFACKSIVQQLLVKDPLHRLGYQGAEEVRLHPWFANIDWEALMNKHLQPPFVPQLSSDADTRYIDNEFVRCPPVDSVVQEGYFSPDNTTYGGFSYEGGPN